MDSALSLFLGKQATVTDQDSSLTPVLIGPAKRVVRLAFESAGLSLPIRQDSDGFVVDGSKISVSAEYRRIMGRYDIVSISLDRKVVELRATTVTSASLLTKSSDRLSLFIVRTGEVIFSSALMTPEIVVSGSTASITKASLALTVPFDVRLSDFVIICDSVRSEIKSSYNRITSSVSLTRPGDSFSSGSLVDFSNVVVTSVYDYSLETFIQVAQDEDVPSFLVSSLDSPLGYAAKIVRKLYSGPMLLIAIPDDSPSSYSSVASKMEVDAEKYGYYFVPVSPSTQSATVLLGHANALSDAIPIQVIASGGVLPTEHVSLKDAVAASKQNVMGGYGTNYAESYGAGSD